MNTKNELLCATWNIRRGLITRELELKNLQKNIDVLFITETDTKNLLKEEDYSIDGYRTVFPERELTFSVS